MTNSDDEPPVERPVRGQPGSARIPALGTSQIRRRRAGAVAGVVVILAALGVAIAAVLGVAEGGRRRLTTPAVTSTATSTAGVSTTTTAHASSILRPAPRRGPLPVARTTLPILEPASAASAPAGGDRSLPTIIRYPRLHGAAAAGRAAPKGGFPLIVFSQGFDVAPESYAALLRTWAAAGFVVADPTFPDTDPDVAGGPDENDIVNHPADLRFIIGAVLRAAREPQSPLHGLVNPGKVAVIGQSDGGDVSLAVAADSCCRDRQVRAAVILSGAELSSFGGSYFSAGSVPLLVVQGSADTINLPGCSALIYDDAPRPKYYLDLIGAEHLPPYLDPGPVRQGIARVVTAFLDAYLDRRPAQLRRLTSAGTLTGGLRLSSASEAPQAPSACPGAP